MKRTQKQEIEVTKKMIRVALNGKPLPKHRRLKEVWMNFEKVDVWVSEDEYERLMKDSFSMGTDINGRQFSMPINGLDIIDSGTPEGYVPYVPKIEEATINHRQTIIQRIANLNTPEKEPELPNPKETTRTWGSIKDYAEDVITNWDERVELNEGVKKIKFSLSDIPSQT